MIAQTAGLICVADLMAYLSNGDRGPVARGIAALTPVPPLPPTTVTVPTLDHGDVDVTVPAWVTQVHGADRAGFLGDVSLTGDPIDVTVDVYDPMGNTTPAKFFVAHMQADPYCGDVAARIPHVDIQVCDDETAECLGPDELAKLSADLRAHADRLDRMRDQLIRARAEWVPPTAPTYIEGIPDAVARQLRALDIEFRIDKLDDGDHAVRGYFRGELILDVHDGIDPDAAENRMLALLREARA